MENTLQLRPVKSEQVESIDTLISTSKPFIEANTIQATLAEVQSEHCIPVYALDFEKLISIGEFIEATQTIIQEVYRGEQILQPNIRLSHPIRSRVPSALNKRTEDLEEWEKSLYYQRAAFIFEIPSVQANIDGNSLSLIVGGVKSYQLDRLQGRRGSDEHFSFFVGFKVHVCSNTSVWNDGYSKTVAVKSLGQLKALMRNLFDSYNSSHQLHHLRRLSELELTENQFCQMVGRCRVYQHLPSEMKGSINPLLFGDSQINSVVRDYYRDDSFCRQDNGSINLWKLYNLFTSANKSSYVDSFLDRSVNAYNFVEGIRWELEKPGHSWFLN